MDAPMPATLIHYYDTDSRSIACGVHGLEHRSTKHARQVTCATCTSALRGRPAQAAPIDAGASEPGASPA